MKLFLLKRVHPPRAYSDLSAAFVIAAETNSEARKLAKAKAGTYQDSDVWLMPEHTTCRMLAADAAVWVRAGVIVEDFHGG